MRAALPTTRDNYGLIHFDFESDNLSWNGNEVSALDFAMTAPEPSKPLGPKRVSPAWSNRLGWTAVALATLATSFMAMFAGGETVAWGWEAIGHYGQVLVLVGVSLLVLTVPWGGVVFALPGLFSLARLRGSFGVILGLLLILTGVLFVFGNPRPRRARSSRRR